MSYKTILVYCEDEDRTHRLLEVACKLARDSEAHLIGFYPYAPVYLPAIMDEAYGAEIHSTNRKRWEDQAIKLQNVFEETVANQPFVGEWRTTKEICTKRLSNIVAEECRAVDLAVVSQSPEIPHNSASDVPEEVAFESGRPVLVVPNNGKTFPSMKRALIAWNGQKESARAVFDALPLLKHAENVRIVTITSKNDDVPNDVPGSELALALARHGVNVEIAEHVTTDTVSGDVLLDYAADHDRDLLVMGCYGHSRFREFVFGGVTNHVLAKMSMPVLLSH